MKRQDDEDGGSEEPNAEELCDGRPAEEYFRLSTSGDCREVVRSVTIHQHQSPSSQHLTCFIIMNYRMSQFVYNDSD